MLIDATAPLFSKAVTRLIKISLFMIPRQIHASFFKKVYLPRML